MQLYVATEGSKVERAPKELKAFARVALSPGETRTVRLSVPAADLAYFDAATSGWVVEPINTPPSWAVTLRTRRPSEHGSG